MSQSIKLTAQAATKMTLHCLRYPSHQYIYGLLIGQSSADHKKNADSGVIVDVIPICHTPLLQPMLDMWIAMTEAQLEPSNSIIGCYFLTGEKSTHQTLATLFNKEGWITLSIEFSPSNEQPSAINPSIKLYPSSANRPLEIEKFDWSSDVVKGLHRKIIDWEAHTDDIRLPIGQLKSKA